MELYTKESTETKDAVESAVESENAAEDKRTSQGPDVEIDLKDSEKKTDEKSDTKGSEAKTVDVDPEKVIESLSKTEEEKKPAPGNFDKGLQKFQMTLSDLAKQVEETKESQAKIQELLSKVPDRKEPDKDDLEMLKDLSDEDLVDGRTVKQTLKAIQTQSRNDLKELVKELKQQQEQLAVQMKPTPQPLSEDQVVSGVAKMFPDLDAQYARYIVQQASPAMEQFKRDNPKASRDFQDFAATGFLTDQANIVRSAIAAQSNSPPPVETEETSSNGSETGKPKASTKIVDNSASSVTAVKTAKRPMVSVADAREKWLNKKV